MTEKSKEMIRHWLVRCQCDTPSPMDAGVHDATYCTECYAWLSPRCRDKKCTYCADRPPYNTYARKMDRALELDEVLEDDLIKFFGKKDGWVKEAPIGGAEKTGFCMTNSLIEHPQNGARTGNLASSARTISIAYVQFFVPGNSLEIPWSNNCQSNFQQHCLTVMCKRFWSTINVRRYQRSFDTKLKCWLQRNGLKNPGSGTSLVLKWLIFLIFWCTHHRFNLDSNSCKENQVC